MKLRTEHVTGTFKADRTPLVRVATHASKRSLRSSAVHWVQWILEVMIVLAFLIDEGDYCS